METEKENSYQPVPQQSSQGWLRISRFFDSIRKAVIVMGSCLLLFAAARNSFHWHIHRLWGATGSFWQSCWDYIYKEWFFENDLMMILLGTFIVTTVFYWMANAFFILLEMTGCPNWALKYKIQDDKKNAGFDTKPDYQVSNWDPWNQIVEMPMLLNAIKQVLYNQFIVGIPFLTCAAPLVQRRGCPVGGDLPTFHWVMFEILIFSFVLEFFFYYSHRLLHHPKLYKYIHKHHHEWTAPIGITALYAHPVEYVVGNILPLTLGPLFMGSHLASSWMWFCLALMSTTLAHCGYHMPLFPSPEAHDFHHLKFNQNFGVLGVLDRLHGTDTMFRSSRQYQRHVMLLSLAPLSQQYPDSPKKKSE